MGHKGHYSKGKKETHKGSYCRWGGARGKRGTEACHDFTKLSFFRRSFAIAMVVAEIHLFIPPIPSHISTLLRHPSFLLKFDTNLESLEFEALLSVRLPKFHKTFALLYTSRWILILSIPIFINMHNYLRVTLVLSCLGSILAFPFPWKETRVRSFLTGRALTPDNTCGNVQNGQNKGYSCDPSIENGGGCCSSSGFCG